MNDENLKVRSSSLTKQKDSVMYNGIRLTTKGGSVHIMKESASNRLLIIKLEVAS